MKPELILKDLTKEAKIWTAKAIAGVIIADGVVTSEEVEILSEAIDFLDDSRIVGKIITQVKSRITPEISNLNVDRSTAVDILMVLTYVASVDTDFTFQEMEYMIDLGSMLGFELEYTQRVIDWNQENLALQEKKQRLIHQGLNLEPVYHS